MPKSSPIATSTTYMRHLNERSVFHHVYAAGSISIPQLVTASGLSKPTVSAAVAALIDNGLLRRLGVRTGQAGRAPQLFGPEPTAGWVAVLDIGRRWVRLALTDLTGDIVRHVRVPSARDAEGLVGVIEELVSAALAERSLAMADLLQIVVGSPGVYDPGEESFRLASNLPGWEYALHVRRLRDFFAEAGAVRFENDVDLGALGERTRGQGQDIDNFVYLHVGSGVGAGIVLNGRPLRGTRGMAGEIAFMPVLPVPRRGLPDEVRERGMLETAAAADAIVGAARERGMTDATTAEEVLAAAAAGDPRAREVLTEEARLLALTLAAVVTVVDPALVILGGGVGRRLGDYIPAVQAELSLILPFEPPRLEVSLLGDRGILYGGVAAGVELAREIALARRFAND
ncbi:ROK family transcriptional regulator [Streptomyces sp. NPDC088124]|uniref:ROK family transcriptional regulator n=1 Tax=Streptomyces sp. NPDC088124 TaxID=3154654 RepID=UPI00341EE481